MFLAIVWSEVGMVVVKLLLSLSILVLLHEFGHFITARWFGCRVERFFLFFDPWFSLFKKKIGDTLYGIGWLPLGGYVKIAGMIDESMDKEQMAQPAQPWEFRSKPAWQRLIIMLGGIIMNVLVAFAIYAMVLFVWGERKTPLASVKNGIWCLDSVMLEVGFKNGDKIKAIDDKPVTYFEDIQAGIFLGSKVTLERDGQLKTIELPVNLVEKLIESKKKTGLLINERLPAYVGAYSKKDTLNGKKAGLQEMDKIVAIDSTPIQFYDEIADAINNKKYQYVDLLIERNNNQMHLKALVNSDGKIGIPLLADEQYEQLGTYKYERRKYGFFEAFPAGIKMTFEKLGFYVNQFKLIIKPSTGGYKGLGGFKSMANIFPKTDWDWESFWKITAFFSIALAFMNLLPIPALDGGHVLFTLIEMVTGRKPSQKFLEYAQIVGMVLLFALMIYANANDWLGWGKGR